MENKNVVILRSTGIIEDSRTIKLATKLCELDFNVTILGWDRRNEYDEEMIIDLNQKSAKIKFFKLPCSYGGGLKNLFKMMKFHKWLKRQVKTFPVGTIVHACDYDTAKPVYKLCKNKYKLIYDVFDFYSDTHSLPFMLDKIIKKSELSIINSADCTVICTEQRVRQIAGSNPKKLAIIHNTPNIDESSNKVKFNERLKICFIGALNKDRLLEEIADEIPNHAGYDYVFGGLGVFEDKFKKLSETYENVKFLGKLSYKEVLEAEKDCDILFATYNPVILNHKYSAPNKFYEAGALKKPIIVCKNTGIDEIVKEHKTGMIINYSAKAFFDCVDKLDRDRELLTELAENGNKAYKELFSWEIMEKRIEEIYREL